MPCILYKKFSVTVTKICVWDCFIISCFGGFTVFVVVLIVVVVVVFVVVVFVVVVDVVVVVVAGVAGTFSAVSQLIHFSHITYPFDLQLTSIHLPSLFIKRHFSLF